MRYTYTGDEPKTYIDAHRIEYHTQPLYPERVGTSCEIIGVDPEEPYGFVVRFEDGFHGIAEESALRREGWNAKRSRSHFSE